MARRVRDALLHLHDTSYLRRHPLVALLDVPAERDAGAKVRARIVEAIEGLRPPAETPADSAPWHRYWSLRLRYVDGLDAARVASKLAVGERQERRWHHEAVEALADALRERSPKTGGGPRESSDPMVATAAASTRVAEVVEGVCATVRPLLDSRAVVLDATVPEAPLRAKVGRVALRQALLACLVEAIDRGRTRMALSVEQDPRTIRLVVETGGGPPGTLSDGPALARRLLGDEGSIVAIASDGGGERLEIALPAEPATVLLVDDDADFVRLFRRCLAGSPYTVIVPPDLADAAALARSSLPDVIVLDVLMPSRDGWELLHDLRADARTERVPVVICSALREESLAHALGAAAWLEKPVNPPELLDTLDRCRATAPRATRPAPVAGGA